MNLNFFKWQNSVRHALGLLALLLSLPLLAAERGGPRPSAPRPMAPAPRMTIDRSSHGTVRHAETHVIQRPAPVIREPERHVEVHRDIVVPHHDVFVHRDVDVDVHRHHFWNDFVFHSHIAALPFGFLTLNIGGAPYYYSDGIYYQPAQGGYQEVYPPVGAAVPQPPDGAIEVDAGGVTYYYAGGAFYLQQPDGSYSIAPTPIGVVVPEVPPGAVQVNANGQIAYQFNNIYYEPVFVDGVTQYQTFVP